MDSGQKKVFHLHNLQQLREFQEHYSCVVIGDSTKGKVFNHDPKDASSADNGNAVILSVDGRRWKCVMDRIPQYIQALKRISENKGN